jgi:predicted MFS family arabinose efflux permease
MTDTNRRAWISVAIMTLGAFVVVVNVSLLSPLLRPIATDFGVSESYAGRLGTVASITGAIAAILVAPLMDRISLRSWFFWQTLILIAVTIGSALAPTFSWLLLARMGAGVSMILAKSLASCAEIFDNEQRRNRAIGIVVSAATAGVIAGLPVIALVEDAAGWRWAFASLLVPLAILLAANRLLPATVTPVVGNADLSFTDRYRQVLGHRRARVLLFAGMILGFSYFGWLTYLGAYVEVDFGGDAKALSLIFLVAGAGELIANNFVPNVLRRWSAPALYAVCGVGYAFALAVSGLGTEWMVVFFTTSTMISVFSAAQYISINILLLDSIPEARGAAMSLATGAMGIGGAIGVAVAGFALDTFDDYGSAFRVLAISIPIGIVAVSWSMRSHKTGPAYLSASTS